MEQTLRAMQLKYLELLLMVYVFQLLFLNSFCVTMKRFLILSVEINSEKQTSTYMYAKDREQAKATYEQSNPTQKVATILAMPLIDKEERSDR